MKVEVLPKVHWGGGGVGVEGWRGVSESQHFDVTFISSHMVLLCHGRGELEIHHSGILTMNARMNSSITPDQRDLIVEQLKRSLCKQKLNVCVCVFFFSE